MVVMYWLDSFSVSGSAASSVSIITGRSRRSLVPSISTALSAKNRSQRVRVRY